MPSAVPAVRTTTSRGTGKLLASDGIFDFYTNEAAVEIVRGVLRRAAGGPPRGVQERAQRACDRLVRAVTHSGHNADNVTVVLAVLADVG